MNKKQFTPPPSIAKMLKVFSLALLMFSLVQTSYACDMFAGISKTRVTDHALNHLAVISQAYMTELYNTGHDNSDGCGFGIYFDDPQDVEIYRDANSIRNSSVYNYVKNEILVPYILPYIPVYTLMAHARLRSSGPEGGVHPFRWNSRLGDGKVYTFMHNGSIAPDDSLRLVAALNDAGFSNDWIQEAYMDCHNVSTAPAPGEMVDSELMFYLIMGMTERYRDIYTGMNQALFLIDEIEDYTSLNYILTDGTTMYSYKKSNTGNDNTLHYLDITWSRPMLIIKSMGVSDPPPIDHTELLNDQLLIYHQGDNAPTVINNFASAMGELTNLSAGVDWRSFPVMNDDVVNAQSYLGAIVEDDFGSIRYGDQYYVYNYLTNLDIRRDAGYILNMQNQVDDFLMKGTLTPEDYPVQIAPGENWIGYFLKDSYAPQVALNQVWSNINRVEAQNWYMYRGKFGEWIGMVQHGANVAMNYGEMYKIYYYGSSTSFTYQQIGSPLSSYTPPATSFYTYTESPAYLAAVVQDPGWETMPDEIAILKDGVVVGASVVSEYPVLVRAYTDDLEGIDVEACYFAKSGHAERRVVKSGEFELVSTASGVYEIHSKNPVSDVENIDSAMIIDITVHPNPIQSWSRISVDTSAKGTVQMSIYNLKGQRVKSFMNEMKSAGTHSVLWDGRDSSGNKLASGIYFMKVRMGNESRMQKLMLIN